jgi:hypothetical protein
MSFKSTLFENSFFRFGFTKIFADNIGVKLIQTEDLFSLHLLSGRKIFKQLLKGDEFWVFVN